VLSSPLTISSGGNQATFHIKTLARRNENGCDKKITGSHLATINPRPIRTAADHDGRNVKANVKKLLGFRADG
jgi:hypothetical protein